LNIWSIIKNVTKKENQQDQNPHTPGPPEPYRYKLLALQEMRERKIASCRLHE